VKNRSSEGINASTVFPPKGPRNTDGYNKKRRCVFDVLFKL
jgi:hypothetical protein